MFLSLDHLSQRIVDIVAISDHTFLQAFIMKFRACLHNTKQQIYARLGWDFKVLFLSFRRNTLTLFFQDYFYQLGQQASNIFRVSVLRLPALLTAQYILGTIHMAYTGLCFGQVWQLSIFTHHWFRYLLVAWPAPSHYLNQCWDIVNCTLRN